MGKRKPTEPSSEFMCIRDVSHGLGVSVPTVHLLIKHGKLPALAILTNKRKQYRIRRSDFKAYVESIQTVKKSNKKPC